MRAAGLEVVCNVMTTEAVLISNPQAKHPKLVTLLNKRIQGCLAATRFQMMQYNIERAKLSEAFKVTPGKRSPTVSPLEDPDWVGVGALVSKKDVSEIMDKLEDLGATDILVFAVENCRV